MKIGIRAKLILAITALIIIIFSVASFLFVKEKRVELAQDIYKNTLEYTQFTAAKISYFYDVYLDRGSFLPFNREIQTFFDQNEYIGGIKVASFDGKLLYDSAAEREKKYEGEERAITDENLLKQARSEYASVLTADGALYFIKGIEYVDELERPLPDMEEGSLLKNIAAPASETHTVIYELDYEKLFARIAAVKERIVYLALFGIFLGFIMAFVISGQIMKPVAALVESSSKIAKGDFTARVDIRTKDEMEFLGHAFNQMAKDLGASVEALIYQQKILRELELASEIQKQLIPKNIPKVAGLDISAGLVPASEIGGDLYDFLPLAGKKLTMYLGDVTGHGVPAGIVSAIANALLFSLKWKYDNIAVLKEVNLVMRAKCTPNVFMTLCFMEWDAEKKTLHFVSAGHEPLLHYSAGRKRAQFLSPGGIALGMTDDIGSALEVREVKLAPGDFVVAYSDGITETWKNEHENYGKERFLAAVSDLGDLPNADKVREAIFADAKTFAAGYKQMDDMTVMVIKCM